ncbi:MAG TPA: D-alanyl-D-alanine carboxypeptidase/D-alanyl-D-alanine-endopeptidase [Longimicrobiales bacterium]|nr:D-alanyl-D-alanine carboxypeptidase/D-alanyl-D-alanine-endopeptidase [Longimicrobiales bacterium]
MRALGSRAVFISLLGLTPVGLQAQELNELRSHLAGIFGTGGWQGASWGVAVVSLDEGDTLFAVEPDAPRSPASNLKLLTTAAALQVLGPEYRFRTYLLTDGEIEGGVVRGNLILYGTGDPGISDRFFHSREAVFNRLIDELDALGVHTVAGHVVGDASFLPGPLRPEGWDARDLNDHFSAAVSALSFNENVLSFRVVPAAPGEPPAVHTVPDYPGLAVVNEARTVAAGVRPRVHILRDDPLDSVRVEGRILSGARDVWRQMTVSVPAHFAAAAFKAELERRGITVAGGVRVVDHPGESVLGPVAAPALGARRARVLARHVSDPLLAYLQVVNKESNNLYAELVFRALGRAAEGVGSPEAGARAVRRELEALGVDMSGVTQLDGSGLSAGNRVSAATFVSVLQRMASGPNWQAYWATLPEAGRRGGLSRMYRTAAAGNLRAKTGTIEGVSALTGMVRSADGERIAFSLLVNGTRSTSRAKTAENEVGAVLASFRRPAISAPAVSFVEAVQPLPSPSAIEVMRRDAWTGDGSRHRVASGESLWVIAGQYGISVDELVRANPLIEPNRILAGQWIDIPRRGGGE